MSAEPEVWREGGEAVRGGGGLLPTGLWTVDCCWVSFGAGRCTSVLDAPVLRALYAEHTEAFSRVCSDDNVSDQSEAVCEASLKLREYRARETLNL